MRKLNKQSLKSVLLFNIILLSIIASGCNSKDYSDSKNPETASSNFSSRIEDTTSDMTGTDTADEPLDDNDSIDTSVSSAYYLSLGVLDENVVRNGAGRNESEVTVIGKNIIFPQGGIRSISIKSWSRKERAYNQPKPEIIQYMDILESAVIIDSVPESVLDGMVKIETHILYLNSHDEFRTISVTNFGSGYHEISVEKDDAEDFAKKISIKSDNGKKYHQVFLRSMEAEEIIKKWVHWEKQGKDGFGLIKSARMSYDGNADGIELQENQLKKLKAYLKSGRKTDGAPCGYENYFECTQDDGSKFHFSISADGESISTDKSVYTADYPGNEKIMKLLKRIRKSAEK